jgi:F-type H+-transporting ATPase subunit gamma
VDLVQAQFLSAISTPPATVRVLPVEPPASKHGARTARPYILEPGADAILAKLLPLYVRNAMYRGLVETVASEHGARRTAMKNATDNAGEILEVLKRTYNRQRQAAITQEISEIVGGAAALQG